MATASRLPAGKLPTPLLRRLLSRIKPARGSRVVVGPGVGFDAAAIDFGRRSAYLVIKADPITFLAERTFDIGAYALTINANDLATMGATPRWFLATVLFPMTRTTRSDVSRVFSRLLAACRRLDVTLCGGHTEITGAVTRPVVAGCLLGDCPKDRLITSGGARPGDTLLLTKGIPIEAVSILARERAHELRRYYTPAFVARCRRYMTVPGISVLRDAQLAVATGGVHAMHDPTEGGLSAALYELADASRVGLRIDQTAIRVLPEAARLCATFGLDPLGAIASGALLISADPKRAHAIMVRLARDGIEASRIGRVMPRRHGVRLVGKDGGVRPLPTFARDELARFLSVKRSL
jgi:hydrogenase expression/formation protein HypE